MDASSLLLVIYIPGGVEGLLQEAFRGLWRLLSASMLLQLLLVLLHEWLLRLVHHLIEILVE